MGVSAQTITVVMYHYVRNLANSRYPRIKGLSVERFRGQLGYLAENYDVIDAALLRAILRGERKLDRNAAFLTFDDGLADHIEFVLPVLEERGLSGAFFVSALPLVAQVVLDVHKIHFILDAVEDCQELVNELLAELGLWRKRIDLSSDEDYMAQWARDSRWDPKEIVFVKCMLQKALPRCVRQGITDAMFRKFVTEDEAAFASNLYMTGKDLKTLKESGMEIGLHGYDHEWLHQLTQDEQRADLALSLEVLSRYGLNDLDWMMAYPYGAYNDNLLDLLSDSNCCAAFTTAACRVEPGSFANLELPRLDTNDLPFAPLKEKYTCEPSNKEA